MWVRIINFISRRALAKKVASNSSAGVMQPPRLVRNPDNKTITVTMFCPEGSYDEAMAWFCPKAKLADEVIGYMLKNDPGNGHVMFESIGTESDAFVRQLASVANIKGYENAQMIRSARLPIHNISTDDDMTMLETVYNASLSDRAIMQIVLNMDNLYVSLSFKEKDAKALLRTLSTGTKTTPHQ